MPKPPAPEKCKFCGEETTEKPCACGAWRDSYGLTHRKGCAGGFHEECDKDSKEKTTILWCPQCGHKQVEQSECKICGGQVQVPPAGKND